MANGNNVRDQLGASASKGVTDNPVFTMLNGLLGASWRAYAQHQAHIALIDAWGLQGLADAMRIRTADEPVTIRALLGRLVDLDGTPAFTIEVPSIGETVREILDNDMGCSAIPALCSTQQPRSPQSLTMPLPAISSSRSSQTRSGISAGSTRRSTCTRHSESRYIVPVAFKPGRRALHNGEGRID